MEFPISLYYDNENINTQELDLSRGDDDYRKIYISDDGNKKIVIKHLSNTFSDSKRIEGWFRLMNEYRKTGIYCPKIIPNVYGEYIHHYIKNDRDFYVYAEEFAIYKTVEAYKDDNKEFSETFMPDVLRHLGKIASAKLDVIDWPSAYCLLEPFCPPDTTDEATETAVAFLQYVEKNIPHRLNEAQKLFNLFTEVQNQIKKFYPSLPTSCFQADLNDSNILLDSYGSFKGLIDFNLCGKEPILNYAVREALWAANSPEIFGENERPLYYYSKESDNLRSRLFLENMGYIQENYKFTDLEKSVFPILFRYMNSFWWSVVREIKYITDDETKITQLFKWLEFQLTRTDIFLP